LEDTAQAVPEELPPAHAVAATEAVAQAESNEQAPSSAPVLQGVVCVDVARVRSEPRIDAPIIGLVYRGMSVNMDEKAVDAGGRFWFKIFDYAGSQGWMSETLVKPGRGNS